MKTKRDKDHHKIVFGIRRIIRRAEVAGDTRRRHDFIKLLCRYQILTFNRTYLV